MHAFVYAYLYRRFYFPYDVYTMQYRVETWQRITNFH